MSKPPEDGPFRIGIAASWWGESFTSVCGRERFAERTAEASILSGTRVERGALPTRNPPPSER